MMPLVSLIALAATGVIVVRCVCILYQSHWRTHERGPWHWMGFGYSYIAVAAAAMTGAIFIVSADWRFGLTSVSLFLIGTAGLILFDRRQPYCPHNPTCPRRLRS